MMFGGNECGIVGRISCISGTIGGALIKGSVVERSVVVGVGGNIGVEAGEIVWRFNRR